jgi:hypothetical protein
MDDIYRDDEDEWEQEEDVVPTTGEEEDVLTSAWVPGSKGITLDDMISG